MTLNLAIEGFTWAVLDVESDECQIVALAPTEQMAHDVAAGFILRGILRGRLQIMHLSGPAIRRALSSDVLGQALEADGIKEDS